MQNKGFVSIVCVAMSCVARQLLIDYQNHHLEIKMRKSKYKKLAATCALGMVSTYASAALIVLAAGIASALLVRRKIDRLDLVSVLKVRE